MLALRLDYLTGRAIATAYNDRGGGEWPPHPARVFSALVATWAEQDPLDSTEASAERAALEWLERQAAPAVACEEGRRARTVMTHFVPTNDVSLLPARLDSLAARRNEASAALASAQAESRHAQADSKASKASAKTVSKANAALEKAEKQYIEACAVAFAPTDSTPASRSQAQALLPDSRGRQPRTFPSLALPDPIVHLCWSVADSPHQPALDRLAARLVRVGHSSSFVHARWLRDAPEPNWIPDDHGELLLRVTGEGQFERLHVEFERHQGVEPRVLPFRAQRYRAASDSRVVVLEDLRHFDERDWLILKRIGGPSLPLTRGVDVAMAVRGALMRHADQPVAEVISGHAENGVASRAPHLMIVPLAHVGHRHADGAIKGLALLLPRTLDEVERRPVMRALGRWEQYARKETGEVEAEAPPLVLGLGEGIKVEVQRQVWGDPGLAALRSTTWCDDAAHEWLSVTPVALDRNPGDLTQADPAKRDLAFRAAAECIAKGCANVGLPLPETVTVLPSGTWAGGAKAAHFPMFPREPGKTRRVKVHARIRFAQPVHGPVILGAGRYLGLGLFRPVKEETP